MGDRKIRRMALASGALHHHCCCGINICDLDDRAYVDCCDTQKLAMRGRKRLVIDIFIPLHRYYAHVLIYSAVLWLSLVLQERGNFTFHCRRTSLRVQCRT